MPNLRPPHPAPQPPPPVRWQVACWVVVLFGAVGGLLYLQYQPLWSGWTSGFENPIGASALAHLSDSLQQFSAAVWRLLPADRHAEIAQYRLWILGALALLAWLALRYSLHRHARRRHRYALHRAQQAEYGLRELLQETNAAAQQVSATAERIARRGEAITQATEKGATAAQRAALNMRQATDRMQTSTAQLQRLGENAQRLQAASGALQERIAQGKILSLNAAIQAAMCGEGGRDFVATAQQAQRLADGSAQQAREITERAQDFHRHAERTIAALKTAAEDMRSGADLGDDVSAAMATMGRDDAMQPVDEARAAVGAGVSIKPADALDLQVAVSSDHIRAATRQLAEAYAALQPPKPNLFS